MELDHCDGCHEGACGMIHDTLACPACAADIEPQTPPADAPPTREQQPDEDEEDVI